MKIAIFGYGNLGRGVEAAIKYNPDMELVGVFTRRPPESVKTVSGARVLHADELASMKDEIDVLILCGGSATDLPEMTPALARDFNLIDSFDTHAAIPTHFERTDRAAREGGRLALISAGWDPGLFSIARVYTSSVLPEGKNYTFWGRGISQGHSDAIRRIPGVVDARQYTVPVPEAIGAVRGGECPTLTTREKHKRECYVVAEDDADKALIEEQIKTMPNYFADYDTSVTFVSLEELRKNHAGMPHGGSVIRNGVSGKGNRHTVEFSLKLDSNPEFTGSVLVAYARAVHRMARGGRVGCISVLDVAPADLSPMSRDELMAHML
ncbi:MAG: diaminopimelate dehydrogenase [Clostridia bacterium]|nr:diaminopimelate dehydrogenase [Clostridia bacterium]MBQ8371723.1 diaminopimelate dehydrogenase [Clostridia bacterium]